MVLGGHGDDMVPVRSCTTVSGIPIATLVKPEKLDEIEKRVRNAGGEVVSLLKTGSAFCSPAASALQMMEAYVFDQKRLLTACACLNGEYGLRGLYLGVPVIIGANGVEKILEIELTADEKKQLSESAERVQAILKML